MFVVGLFPCVENLMRNFHHRSLFVVFVVLKCTYKIPPSLTSFPHSLTLSSFKVIIKGKGLTSFHLSPPLLLWILFTRRPLFTLSLEVWTVRWKVSLFLPTLTFLLVRGRGLYWQRSLLVLNNLSVSSTSSMYFSQPNETIPKDFFPYLLFVSFFIHFCIVDS